MECLTYCIGNSIDINRLEHQLKIPPVAYFIGKSRDVLRLTSKQYTHEIIFIFKNGTVVSWGIKRYKIHDYLMIINQFIDKPNAFIVRDEFCYRLGSKTFIEPHRFFDVDCLTIEEDSDEIKLSLSYGFSQSVKLHYFETVIEALIEKYTPMIQSLASRGKMLFNRRQIQRIIGEMLASKSEINLNSNFFYHPKFFWQHPTLEEHYIMLERYLHIPRRITTINHRLNTLNEIFDLFHGYLESKHSHRLEVIIIVLIAVEIILAVLNIHL